MPDALLIAIIVIGALCALLLAAAVVVIMIFAVAALFGRKRVVEAAAPAPTSRRTFVPSEAEYASVLAEVEAFRRRPNVLLVEELEWYGMKAVHVRHWSMFAAGQVSERTWIEEGDFHRDLVRSFGIEPRHVDSIAVIGPATMTEISDYHAAIHRLTGVTLVAVDGISIPRSISHRAKSIRA